MNHNNIYIVQLKPNVSCHVYFHVSVSLLFRKILESWIRLTYWIADMINTLTWTWSRKICIVFLSFYILISLRNYSYMLFIRSQQEKFKKGIINVYLIPKLIQCKLLFLKVFTGLGNTTNEWTREQYLMTCLKCKPYHC